MILVISAFALKLSVSCKIDPKVNFVPAVKETFPQMDIYSEFESNYLYVGIDTVSRDVYVIKTAKASTRITSIKKLDLQ